MAGAGIGNRRLAVVQRFDQTNGVAMALEPVLAPCDRKLEVGPLPGEQLAVAHLAPGSNLNDPAWLRIEPALGATLHSIADQLRCDRSAVRAARAVMASSRRRPGSTVGNGSRVVGADRAGRAAARRIEVEATAEAQRAQ